jgi:acyl carrier protein
MSHAVSEGSEKSVFTRFQRIVAESLRIDPELVTLDKSLSELGAESLDLIEITMECESAFHVWVPEKGILHMAREVFGSDAILQGELLTDLAKRILAARIPPEDFPLLDGELTVKRLENYFMRVSSWVTMLSNLMRHTPGTCDECAAALEASTGFRLKCTGCQKQFEIPSGDDLNREWLERYYEAQYLPSLEAGQPKIFTQTA